MKTQYRYSTEGRRHPFGFDRTSCSASALVLTLFAIAFAQNPLTGHVLTMTGEPIAAATVSLIKSGLTTTTDDEGFYNFQGATGLRPVTTGAASSQTLICKKNRVVLATPYRQTVALDLFDLSGKLIQSVFSGPLDKGEHAIDLPPLHGLNRMLLLKARIGTQSSIVRISVLDGAVIASSSPAAHTPPPALTKALATFAADSLVVTHPDYNGGLDAINTRGVKADTGVQNFRMFSIAISSDGWFASRMNFNFTPETQGVRYYKELIPEYAATEQQVQREIQQCLWRTPDEVPQENKWDEYKCDINGDVDVGVAATGGNNLLFDPTYIDGQSWWELLGVQHHEMVHSYQQFYDTQGAEGFGEAIPDAVRALCGFFHWPKGTRCSGGYGGFYQDGGKYWYYIELKHPGFIYKVMNAPQNGDISTRVQQITGESLDAMCAECESKGMPYTLGRGEF
jgi:hypothetical protein